MLFIAALLLIREDTPPRGLIMNNQLQLTVLIVVIGLSSLYVYNRKPDTPPLEKPSVTIPELPNTLPLEVETIQAIVEEPVVVIPEPPIVIAAIEPAVKKPIYDKSIKPSNTKAYIPSQAFEYFDTIKKEQERIIPDFAYPHYFAGLIEHESCISLTHSKCWNPKSQLKSKREEGAGLSMITRTWNEDGSQRFDTLADLRRAHMQELKELSWSNVYQRPDLQVRSMIILVRTNYKALYQMEDTYQRLAAADSAYNGGLGGVKKQRQICGLKADCNPQTWFDQLEKIIVKSTKPLYAGRSADTINKHHVQDVLKIRMPKYQPYLS